VGQHDLDRLQVWCPRRQDAARSPKDGPDLTSRKRCPNEQGAVRDPGAGPAPGFLESYESLPSPLRGTGMVPE